MANRSIAALVVGVVLACTSLAPAQTQNTLPLTKVRLYETGVGYFERTGPLPTGGTGLPVPVGHLDDALKTLVILDAEGKSTVSGIAFPSLVTGALGRALAGLPPGEGEALSLPRLLVSLEGATVELHAGRETLRGRIADVVGAASSGVERCVPGTATADQPCTLRQESTVVVLAESGELRRLLVADVTGVRPLDPATRARLDAALDAVTEGGTRSQRWLEVAATGGRKVSLGYVAEAPVWRSTYRLVLAPGDAAGLQGWALVHNDTDEDWHRVALELVNGQPDSFLFPLAAPRYARRPLVTPDNDLSTVPQLLDTTVDRMWGDEIGEAYGAGGLGLSGIGEGGGGRAEGIGMGSIGTYGHGAGTGDAASSVVTVGSLAALAPAEGLESESLFQYSIATPLDLGAHASAIVPFVSVTLTAERIAWFQEAGAPARAAVHLTNTSNQTLPGGTIAVFADGGFAGEAVLARTKPREERILRIGNDLDVELKERGRRVVRTPRSLEFDPRSGALCEHYVERLDIRYELVNRSGAGRLAYLDLNYQDNARVEGADRLGFDSERGIAQAVFTIAAHSSRQPVLVVELGRMDPHPGEALTVAWLEAMAETKSLPAAQREVLLGLVKLERSEAQARKRGKEARTELARREHDLERLRASVEALSGARARTLRQLVHRIDRVETEIESLDRVAVAANKEVERLRARKLRLLLRLVPGRATRK